MGCEEEEKMEEEKRIHGNCVTGWPDLSKFFNQKKMDPTKLIEY